MYASAVATCLEPMLVLYMPSAQVIALESVFRWSSFYRILFSDLKYVYE